MSLRAIFSARKKAKESVQLYCTYLQTPLGISALRVEIKALTPPQHQTLRSHNLSCLARVDQRCLHSQCFVAFSAPAETWTFEEGIFESCWKLFLVLFYKRWRSITHHSQLIWVSCKFYRSPVAMFVLKFLTMHCGNVLTLEAESGSCGLSYQGFVFGKDF